MLRPTTKCSPTKPLLTTLRPSHLCSAKDPIVWWVVRIRNKLRIYPTSKRCHRHPSWPWTEKWFNSTRTSIEKPRDLIQSSPDSERGTWTNLRQNSSSKRVSQMKNMILSVILLVRVCAVTNQERCRHASRKKLFLPGPLMKHRKMKSSSCLNCSNGNAWRKIQWRSWKKPWWTEQLPVSTGGSELLLSTQLLFTCQKWLKHNLSHEKTPVLFTKPRCTMTRKVWLWIQRPWAMTPKVCRNKEKKYRTIVLNKISCQQQISHAREETLRD